MFDSLENNWSGKDKYKLIANRTGVKILSDISQ